MSTDAFEQGRLAFQNNHPMSSCEYPTGSSLRQDWMNGWNAARNAAPDHSGGSDGGMMKDARRASGLGKAGMPHES